MAKGVHGVRELLGCESSCLPWVEPEGTLSLGQGAMSCLEERRTRA